MKNACMSFFSLPAKSNSDACPLSYRMQSLLERYNYDHSPILCYNRDHHLDFDSYDLHDSVVLGWNQKHEQLIAIIQQQRCAAQVVEKNCAQEIWSFLTANGSKRWYHCSRFFGITSFSPSDAMEGRWCETPSHRLITSCSFLKSWDTRTLCYVIPMPPSIRAVMMCFPYPRNAFHMI